MLGFNRYSSQFRRTNIACATAGGATKQKYFREQRTTYLTEEAAPHQDHHRHQNKQQHATQGYLRWSRGVPTGDMRRTSPEAEANTRHTLAPLPASSVSAHRIDTIGLLSVQALNLLRSFRKGRRNQKGVRLQLEEHIAYYCG